MSGRKVRKDFDKTQPITVDVSECSEYIKKEVLQAFFDVGLYWINNERDLKPVNNYVKTYTNTLFKDTTESCVFYLDRTKEGITPEEFFSMVYEEDTQTT